MEIKTLEEYVLAKLEETENRLQDVQQKYVKLLVEYEELQEELNKKKQILNEEIK